jgi:amidophosphoribosyltransferase
MREMGVRMKLSPLTETLAGKRVVMVDDTIVRGTTTRGTVRMLKEAGAAEVHVRITAPPYRYPCFFGVDTANQSELIASQHSVEEIREHIGADSLGYLSLKGLVNAIGLRKDNFCSACLDGKYPIEIPNEAKLSKFVFEMLTKEEKA